MNLGRRISGRGYILVEVIVSLVVFSIGMLSVMRTFSVAAQARGVAQDYTIANLLCQKLLSESRAMAPESQSLTGKGKFGKAYPGFEWVRTVTAVQIATTRQQEGAEGRKDTGRRRGGSRQRASQTAQEQIAFTETSVTVSWRRRGASYSVSVRTTLPVGAGARRDVGT
jgi:Tfp pilus assembly protein PilV